MQTHMVGGTQAVSMMSFRGGPHPKARNLQIGASVGASVGAVVGERDAPHIGLHASSSSDDGLAVVRDITAGGVEQDFASSVAKNGHGDYLKTT